MAKPASHDPSSAITAPSVPDPDDVLEPPIVPDCNPASPPVTDDDPSPFVVVVGVASPTVVVGVGMVVVGADSLDDF